MAAGHYQLLDDGAMLTDGAVLLWVGSRAELPDLPVAQRVDLRAGWLRRDWWIVIATRCLAATGPGNLKCVSTGRAMRRSRLAAAGSPVQSTPRDRPAKASCWRAARQRIRELCRDGVTALEIKSGYGPDLANERKMLRVIRRLGDILPLTVRSTCPAAHAVPVEYQERADARIDYICERLLPELHQEGLVDAVDAFCEHRIFALASGAGLSEGRELGLPVKLHAEQLTLQHGAALAARYHALSADHLEYLCEEDIAAMARHGTVAVLLPGAYYFLREKQLPPLELLRQYRVPIALASDLNPGTSPVLSLRLMMNMACTLFRMTPEEALAGVTLNGAKALGLDTVCGSLEAGKEASFVAWDIAHPAELSYWLGGSLSKQVIYQGKEVYCD